MYPLIGTTPANVGRYTDTKLNRLLGLQVDEREQVKKHYQTYGHSAGGDHPIVKLVYGLVTRLGSTPLMQYSAAKDLEDDLSLAVKAYSPVNRGKSSKSVYYKDCFEYLVQSDHYSVTEVISYNGDWKSLSPLRVLCHPYVLPHWYLPEGGEGSDTYEYAILAISIPELSVMYHGWYEVNRKLEDTMQESVEQFVGRFVLPGALDTQLQSSYNNASTRGDEMFTTVERPPIFLTNRTEVISKLYWKLFQRATKKGQSPIDTLGHLPNLNGEGMLFSGFPLLDINETVMNDTIRFLAYLPLVHAVVSRTPKYRHMSNLLNRWKQANRLVESRGTIDRIEEDSVRFNARTLWVDLRTYLE